jgi:bifunctional DNA-binding transcriptional regulator/antitoxin component of YhaV-PrlF toxin-antitoxin module
MSLTDNNGSVTVTIPSGAVKHFGLDVGDRLRVEVYEDGVFIPREAPDE